MYEKLIHYIHPQRKGRGEERILYIHYLYTLHTRVLTYIPKERKEIIIK
jgi:hypothetical protein